MMGRPREGSRSTLSVTVPVDMDSWVREEADTLDITISEVVRQAIGHYRDEAVETFRALHEENAKLKDLVEEERDARARAVREAQTAQGRLERLENIQRSIDGRLAPDSDPDPDKVLGRTPSFSSVEIQEALTFLRDHGNARALRRWCLNGDDAPRGTLNAARKVVQVLGSYEWVVAWMDHGAPPLAEVET